MVSSLPISMMDICDGWLDFLKNDVVVVVLMFDLCGTGHCHLLAACCCSRANLYRISIYRYLFERVARHGVGRKILSEA